MNGMQVFHILFTQTNKHIRYKKNVAMDIVIKLLIYN